MKAIKVKAEKCVGCRICEQWCSVGHYDLINPRKSRISVHRSHADQASYPLVCRQCPDAPCLGACPDKVMALSRDRATGAIRVDEESCLACGKCIKACPYGAIKKHPAEKQVLVCDLCGGEPQCVKHCPEQALSYIE